MDDVYQAEREVFEQGLLDQEPNAPPIDITDDCDTPLVIEGAVDAVKVGQFSMDNVYKSNDEDFMSINGKETPTPLCHGHHGPLTPRTRPHCDVTHWMII